MSLKDELARLRSRGELRQWILERYKQSSLDRDARRRKAEEFAPLGGLSPEERNLLAGEIEAEEEARRQAIAPRARSWLWIYHNAQGILDLASRQALVEEYAALGELSPEDRARLHARLADLDARRAARRAAPPAPPPSIPAWWFEPATERQLAALRAARVSVRDGLAKREARSLIAR